MAFAELTNKLISGGGRDDDIIRIRDKSLTAANALTHAAKEDDILTELLLKTYQTDNLLKWTLDWLTEAEHEPLVRLRTLPAYREMLEKHRVCMENKI